MKRVLVLLLALLALGALPAAASPPKPGKIRPTRPCGHGRLPSCHRSSKPKPGAAKPPPAPAIEIGNVPGCRDGSSPVSYLQQYHAMLRVIVNPGNFQSGVLDCAREAVAAGYRLHVVIQWWNVWNVEQIKSFFALILPQVGKLAWAISIGNEQEIATGGDPIRGRAYAQDWQAIEPMVAAQAPQAIRVAGEISPWGFPYLKSAVAYGLPGAQAVAAHPYKMHDCFSLPDFMSWAKQNKLPYWIDEGYLLPGAWLPGRSRSASEVPGAAVVGAWLGLGPPPVTGKST
jgi:hypothetical protein